MRRMGVALKAAGGPPTLGAMKVEWDIVESGPPKAEQVVLLLPGGMCSAGSYAEVMAEPQLAGAHLIAATLPGQAGAPPLPDPSPEAYAGAVAELAHSAGVDVVVGFSMGATVAYEMLVSGSFVGPAGLLGISLSAPDEPAAFRAIIRLGSLLGSLPAVALKKGAASMLKN